MARDGHLRKPRAADNHKELTMKRTIITPPVLTGAPLAELKGWLAISTAGEDTALTVRLAAALELCEAFTGQLPLTAVCEEVLPGADGWQALTVRPVQEITGIEVIAADGTRLALPDGEWAAQMDADGRAQIQVTGADPVSRLAVGCSAGMAADWDRLPGSIRQGLIRLAAHDYHGREAHGPPAAPPACVAALWRPWRRLSLL
jgi:uncharacterized phiE125 gp8 family phage protein